MLNPNPILRKLGFSDHERVAIIHVDDVGMCHASIEAFKELDAFGLISCGAVMVPCPWFLRAAEYARTHPQADLGVHLTLTSEWSQYRWGPISTCDVQTGLLDDEGYFHHRSQPVQQMADPTAVQRELEAQVAKAEAAGIIPTHIDTHMGSVAHMKFMQGYVQLGLTKHVPAMLFRMDEAGWRATGLDAETAVLAAKMMAQLEESGVPLLDHLGGLPLDPSENRLEQAKKAFADLKPGVTHFIIHAAMDTPELRAITPDWRMRVADFETFQSEELRHEISGLGVQVIGYRKIKELIQP